jgi:MoaA/NifB/PqqE/SkfB family radical SAM enzyme
MSNYNNSADIAEHQLKFISKTMCYAKWAQVSMHLTNGMTHSCYHPPLHKIDVKEIAKNPSALHNTMQKKEERRLMLAGEKPAGCAYCWKIEDVGGRSDRIYRSGEYWAQNARKDIIEALDTGNIDPRYMEVNFNQACNFKCMYCSPHLSTAWEDEVDEYGPYDIIGPDGKNSKHNDISYLSKEGLMPLKVRQKDNPYLDAFWRWWPTLYKKLEVFRITGGEPLMDTNTFKVLDYIQKNPNSWLEVSVTTNLCPPKPELMDKFVAKLKKLEEIQIWKDEERFNPGSGNNWYVNMALKNVAVFISLDSVGEQAEYIRSGLDFGILQKNVKTLLTETNNTTVTFINTFNALSLPKFKEYLQYILDLREEYSKDNQGVKYIPIHDPYHTHPDYVIHPRQRIWFDIPLLRYPSWMAIQLLPKEFDQYLEEAVEFMKENSDVGDYVGFYDFEIEKAERNLKILREQRDTVDKITLDRDCRNLVKYFDQYDKRKGTNFIKTFPELKSFYKKYSKGVI